MNLTTFNISLAVGWLMAVGGGLLISPAVALVGGGVSLVVLTLVVVRMVGFAHEYDRSAG